MFYNSKGCAGAGALLNLEDRANINQTHKYGKYTCLTNHKGQFLKKFGGLTGALLFSNCGTRTNSGTRRNQTNITTMKNEISN